MQPLRPARDEFYADSLHRRRTNADPAALTPDPGNSCRRLAAAWPSRSRASPSDPPDRAPTRPAAAGHRRAGAGRALKVRTAQPGHRDRRQPPRRGAATSAHGPGRQGRPRRLTIVMGRWPRTPSTRGCTRRCYDPMRDFTPITWWRRCPTCWQDEPRGGRSLRREERVDLCLREAQPRQAQLRLGRNRQRRASGRRDVQAGKRRSWCTSPRRRNPAQLALLSGQVERSSTTCLALSANVRRGPVKQRAWRLTTLRGVRLRGSSLVMGEAAGSPRRRLRHPHLVRPVRPGEATGCRDAAAQQGLVEALEPRPSWKAPPATLMAETMAGTPEQFGASEGRAGEVRRRGKRSGAK